MTSIIRFLFPILLLPFLLSSSTSQLIKPTQLIESVCKQVTNYTFCVETIYSDDRAPNADLGILARIIFITSYYHITSTTAQITSMWTNARVRKDVYLTKALLHCRSDYRQGSKAVIDAFDFIDSETYGFLNDFVDVLRHTAVDCESEFGRVGKTSPLTKMNKFLKDVSDIGAVVCKLLK